MEAWLLATIPNTVCDLQAEAYGLPHPDRFTANVTRFDSLMYTDCANSRSARDQLSGQLAGQLYVNVSVAGVLVTATPITMTPEWDLVNGELKSVIRGPAPPVLVGVKHGLQVQSSTRYAFHS